MSSCRVMIIRSIPRVLSDLPPLFVEKLIHFARGLRTDAGHLREIGEARPLDRFHSAEMAQQRAFARRPDAGDLLQPRLANVPFAAGPVRADREAGSFVAPPFGQKKQRGPPRRRGRGAAPPG